jgi:hypothetical protein
VGWLIEATVVSVIIRDFIHLTERLRDQSGRLMRDYYEKVCVQVEQQNGFDLNQQSQHGGDFPRRRGAHARRACAVRCHCVDCHRRAFDTPGLPEQGWTGSASASVHSGELIFADLPGPQCSRWRAGMRSLFLPCCGQIQGIGLMWCAANNA